MRANSSLLESKVKSELLNMMSLVTECMQEAQSKKSGRNETKIVEEYTEKCAELTHQLISIIKEAMNKNLIPKYRRIIGETVPLL